MMFHMFDFMFVIVPFLVIVIFIFVICTMFANGITHAKDKKKPLIPVEAKIVSKRSQVTGMDHNFTQYYVTFQLINGERMEFKVKDNEYGYLVEGDEGTLTFQGSIFVSFQRKF